MRYEHTQVGHLTIPVVLLVVAVAVVFVPRAASEGPVGAVIVVLAMLLVATVAALFSRLTVAVGGGQVTAAFGRGWPRKVVRTDQIAGVRRVRNHWILGWGIRWVPGGWMFNVWGRDAVELRLIAGRTLRIGTDEPGALMAAIEAERFG